MKVESKVCAAISLKGLSDSSEQAAKVAPFAAGNEATVRISAAGGFFQWRILLGIIAVTAVLSGCAVAMLGGAARSGSSSGSSGGSAAPTARPASQLQADSTISTAVRSRLSANSTLKPLKITVGTHDGVVTLRGQVNSVEQRNAAQLEARAVKGVKAVKNELVVK